MILNIEDEFSIFQSLESLFDHIQDAQGVPLEEEYPSLADFFVRDFRRKCRSGCMASVKEPCYVKCLVGIVWSTRA